MLTSPLITETSLLPALRPMWPRQGGSLLPEERRGDRNQQAALALSGHHAFAATQHLVEISPAHAVSRHMTVPGEMTAEVVHATGHARFETRFQAPVHLLVVYEDGSRRDGESFVEGQSRSTLRNFARKLSFVPAGHEYREWHEPKTLARLMFVYFNPAALQTAPASADENVAFPARLFFDDATLLETALKLKRSLESPRSDNRSYVEALGVVLAHELVRFNQEAPRSQAPIRGGLAAWQQRTVTAYIDAHLGEPIPLATLARLARLSPSYFCRAFSQSFGVPPHRYHNDRRIERAKALLAVRSHSVTDIAMIVGYSETSSFTAAFRKAVGLTPSAYQRTAE
jgi:AraC family transcriptional regulator